MVFVLFKSGMKSAKHRLLPLSLLLFSSRSCNLYALSSSLSSSLLSFNHCFSSSSSSPDKYEDFFPYYHTEYLSHRIDWYYSRQSFAKSHREVPLLENKPQYIHTSNDFDDPIPIRIGKHFDVISLLSTYSDHLLRIGTSTSNTDFVKALDLRGKYVLLCCAFLPCVWSGWESHFWRQLSLLYSDLSQTRIGSHFEMVIVPKIRKGWDDDEGVFHHSLSAFSGCLTVPFTHNYRRDYICKSLNLDGPARYILVDYSHKVLLDYPHFNNIIRYGARGFPFTSEHLTSLHGEDDWREPYRSCNKTLAGLLSCESNPSFLLHKFDSEDTIYVEQLNKHLVGLYLFQEGDKLKSFHNLYQKCRNQGLDFEIVLVCLPFNYGINPNDFQDVVHCAMKKHRVSNWWVFPFNNSTCRRLYNLSERLYNLPSKCSGDSMIIVGPHNKFVDGQGGDLVTIYGSHFGTQMYPFTMEALLQVFVQKLETITVESFLGTDYVYRDYECDDSKRMPLSELKGTNFFVLIAFSETIELHSEWYNIMKVKDSNFEVIFVHATVREYPKPSSIIREIIFESKTKFLVCPFDDPKHPDIIWDEDDDAFLCKIADLPIKGLPIPLVLAFGKDGRLQTLNALRFLGDHGLDAYPFPPESRNLNLCNDISGQICDEFPDLRENSTLRL